ncbi:competence protein CoiA-like protein [Peribacillus frigoritolerans]|uniref:competence protein CoiA n=1 Tax=Peribacillus frigoritolerans TaxID=450367 RepID=UPI001EFE6AE9|nr:competence protein CoiA family protein [Peribacillus frigoritolerans]ULM96437.1 competence protein CoiA-like protein [Peribacillus frigoritolerans]
MIRCITSEKETLIASNCEVDRTKKLSKEKQLYCPNCQSTVIFKPGNIYRSHFAHFNSECVVTNYEPETTSHIKGKQILFEWLSKNYPDAVVQYEVYIPETKQIADVFVIHSGEGMEGVRWAFEFQHSPLSSKDWENRHELYQSVGIQDFWILDKAKYMRFSKAQGITDARNRKDLETAIYNESGLCYFLDLSTSELTIDFEFTTSYETRNVRGINRRNPYTYHSPIIHSFSLDQAMIRMNEEFMHGAFVFPELISRMEPRLSFIIRKLMRKKEEQEALELKEKAVEKKKFAEKEYGQEKTDVIWQFMKTNKEALTEDVRYLQPQTFFEKYHELIERLLLDIQELNIIKDSEDFTKKILASLIYESELYDLTLLNEQGALSLEEYVMAINQETVSLVTYVYETYKEELEKLASMHPKHIERELGKINYSLTPWESNPTAVDYALKYRRLETMEEADEYMKQIKDKIINYDPFADMKW